MLKATFWTLCKEYVTIIALVVVVTWALLWALS